MSQSSDPLDPLPGHSILSLFPRTIEASTSGSNNGELNNLESIHDIMKSAGLRGADKLLEKAKAIVDGGSEFLYSKFSSFVVSVGNDETNSAKDKEKAQERRPGLGLKRARFSFKGNGSQPASSFLRPLDIDQLRDPEEFFLAYERRENAKKEIERLNGGSLTVLNENSPPRKERHRRPGILGNKSKPVRYKHRYSSVRSQNDPYAFSQEKLEESFYNSADHDMKIQTTVPIVEIEETEIAESTAPSEDKVNETLDILLSSKSGDLDEDVTLSLLQRHLQIKSFDPNEYCIPDFCEIESIDFVNPGGKLSKPQKALSNLHDFLKGTSSKTPSKHNEAVEKPIYLLASSTSPKSPLGASMSLLRKRSFQSISSQDPFSSDNIDVTQVKSPGEQIDKHLDQCDPEKLGLFGKLKSQVGDEITKSKDANMCSKEAIDSFSSVNVDLSPVTRPVEQIGKQFGQFDLEKELHASGKLKSAADQIKKTTASNPGLKDLIVGDSDHLLSKSVTDYSRQEGVGPNVRPTEMCNDVMYERNVGEEVEYMSQQGEHSAQPDNCIEHSTRTYTDSDTQMYDNTEREENVEGLQQKAVSSEQVDISVEELATKNMSGRQHLLVQSNISPIEDHISDVPYKASEIGPEQKIKKCPNKLSLREDKEKKPSRKGKQGKVLSHRQSLADAGTSWESGLRRSSRNRMRPLEYWKGERFLYGRVHGSLTTVIGVKYMSPAKDDGEPTVKVKSYVSNEYKELLDLAALH